MRYLLYLRRSLTRDWREHLLLALLLACAIALPLCMSIYDTSTLRGWRDSNYHFSHGGHNFWIQNAVAGDEELFTELTGGVPVWDNGYLYVDRTADNPVRWEDGRAVGGELQTELQLIVVNTGRPELTVDFMDDQGFDTTRSSFPDAAWIAVVLFSGLLQAVFLLFYWKKREAETQKLSFIGATPIQLGWLLFAETMLSQITASAVSLGASVCFIYTLIQSYFYLYTPDVALNDLTTIAWVRFDLDPKQLVLLILILLLLSAAVCLVYTLFLCRRDARKRLGAWRIRRHPRIHAAKMPTTILRRTFLRANTMRICGTMLLALALLTASSLLLKIQASSEKSVEVFGEEGISVSLKHYENWNMQKLQFLNEIPGISEIVPKYVSRIVNLVLDERATFTMRMNERAYSGYYADMQIAPDNVIPYAEETDGRGENVYPVAVYSENILYRALDEETDTRSWETLVYPVGECLTLWAMSDDTIELEVVKILTEEEYRKYAPQTTTDEALSQEEKDSRAAQEAQTVHLFFREEDLAEIDAQKPLTGFTIMLDNPLESTTIQKKIYDLFGTDEIRTVVNHEVANETSARRSAGTRILYRSLSALLFAFFATITTLSLVDYAAMHKNTIRLLHMQGAPHRSIIAAFVEIMLPPGILTCAAVWAIVTPVEREYYRLRGYSDAFIAKLELYVIDKPLFLTVAAAVVLAVFVAPVVWTVGKELRHLDKE